MTNLLKNKLALVTGASGGIGAAISKRLAQEGAFVLIHYNAGRVEAESVMSEIQKAGGDAAVLTADLSQVDGPAKLIALSTRPSVDGFWAVWTCWSIMRVLWRWVR